MHAIGAVTLATVLLVVVDCGSVANTDGHLDSGSASSSMGPAMEAGGSPEAASVDVVAPDVVDAEVPDATVDATEDAPAEAGSADGSDGAAPLASCSQILAAMPGAPSGIYVIQPVPGAAAYSVYCDMTLDGGGWTRFFAGKNGSTNVFNHFETVAVDCTDPQMHCLRRLPANLDPASQFAATCGGAAVKFQLSAAAFSYFQNGVQAGWQLTSNISQIIAGNTSYSGAVWTGATNNPGWIVSSATEGNPSTMSTFSDSYNPNTSWDYCNGVADQSSAITLAYR
jgi:hypothetical protein